MASTPSGGSSETSVQNFIHAIEQGRFAGVMRNILFGVGILAVALAYLGWNFTGFSSPEAMDQAQVAREIARGHGFSTKFIRPLALWQIENNGGALPHGNFPDTYNAPLPPLLNALAFRALGDEMNFDRNAIIAPVEKAIVVLSMLCFLGAVAINYFLLARLFDQRLAAFASLLVLVTDLFWQYTLSGLPQMFMLLLFSGALYALVRALETHAGAFEGEESAEIRRRTFGVGGWLALAGFFLGLLALCHGVAAWIAVGALVFGLVHFRRRGPVALLLLATFGLVIAPWMVRTYHVSGNPFGLAGYAIFDGLGSSTASRMRSVQGPGIEDIAPLSFRLKVEHSFASQLSHVTHSLGGSLVTVLFFVSLLHPFRRPETSALRWAVLWMWLFAIGGMCILGGDASVNLAPWQMGVLFAPVMTGFGLALGLVLFSRLEANSRSFLRVGFSGVLVAMTAVPMLVTLLPERKAPHNYPPYFEPFIQSLHDWTKDDEIIASDMPWGVAFYADRRSLWIPNKLRDLLGLSDQGKLDGPLAGLFLTPISRNTSFIASLYRGEYQEYNQLIFGSVNVPYFPFQEAVQMTGDLNYTFYSDSRRWDKKRAP